MSTIDGAKRTYIQMRSSIAGECINMQSSEASAHRTVNDPHSYRTRLKLTAMARDGRVLMQCLSDSLVKNERYRKKPT